MWNAAPERNWRKAITGFRNGFVPISPEQLSRDFVHEQQAIRQAQKDGTLPVRDHGPGIGKSVFAA